MDFEEFARGFRERTAARLLEFELALDKAEKDLERDAKDFAATQRGTQPHGDLPRSAVGRPHQGPKAGDGLRGRPPGRVRSVLRGGD